MPSVLEVVLDSLGWIGHIKSLFQLHLVALALEMYHFHHLIPLVHHLAGKYTRVTLCDHVLEVPICLMI